MIHGDTVLKIEIQPKDRTKLVLHCSIPNSTRQLQWDLRFAGDQVSARFKWGSVVSGNGLEEGMLPRVALGVSGFGCLGDRRLTGYPAGQEAAPLRPCAAGNVRTINVCAAVRGTLHAHASQAAPTPIAAPSPHTHSDTHTHLPPAVPSNLTHPIPCLPAHARFSMHALWDVAGVCAFLPSRECDEAV